MTVLLVVALGVPLAGAVAAVLLGRGEGLVAVTAGIPAVAWAVLVAADPAASLGRIDVGPLTAAALAGASLLVATTPHRDPLGRSAALCGLTVLAVAASTGDGDLPDRPLAVGLLVLLPMGAVAVRSSSAVGWGRALVVVGPVALVAVGLLQDDPGPAGVLVAVGAGGAVAAMVLVGPVASVLAPAVVLAAARVAGWAAIGGDGEPGAVVAVAVAGVTALALVALARRLPSPTPFALVALAAALALVGQDLEQARSAGLLVAAGAVLALAARRPVGLLALAPGTVAAVDAAGVIAEPRHAAAAVVAIVLVAAGSELARSGSRRAGPPPRQPTRDAASLVAVVFAVVPLWGWTGASPDGYPAAVATAAAAGGAAAVGALALGRLRSRPHAVSHASTQTPAQEGGPVEAHPADPVVDRPEPDGEDEAGRPSKPPVAVSPRAVPLRARPDRVAGRGRLRARPGRPPG